MSVTNHRVAMLDVAGRVANNRTTTTGERWARTADHPQKRLARAYLNKIVSRRAWPKGLALLTMPGLHWQFEDSLLHAREPKSVFERDQSFKGCTTKRTHLTCLEREPAIFLAAMRNMPGSRSRIAELEAPDFASRAVQTNLVRRFYLASAEAYMEAEGTRQDIAWFDFNGGLTTRRLDAIRSFWRNDGITSHLALTVMRGRETPDVTSALHAAGGVGGLIRRLCPGSEVVQMVEYRDGATMNQLILKRVN